MTIEKTNVTDIIDKNYAEFDLGLLCEDKYKSLKHIDMVVYTVLNNQHGLSVKTTLNGSKKFIDKNGYIFISIGQEKLCDVLRTTRPTLLASLKRLEAVNLIEVVNIGNMKCNRIYVGKLKRSITFGDYMKEFNISDEDDIDFVPSIDVKPIDNVIEFENKKAPSTAIEDANKNVSNNQSNDIISQSDINNTSYQKKSQLQKLTKKYNNNSNKKRSTIFMADSKVEVNGQLISVSSLTEEEFEQKLKEKWGK